MKAYLILNFSLDGRHFLSTASENPLRMTRQFNKLVLPMELDSAPGKDYEDALKNLWKSCAHRMTYDCAFRQILEQYAPKDILAAI